MDAAGAPGLFACRLYHEPIDGAIPYPDPPLRGQTFALRPFRPGDFERAAVFADPSGDPGVQPLPSADATEVTEFFEHCRVAGEMLHLVIASPDNDTYLGEVMLNVNEDNVGELGCGVLEAERGRGTATQALRLLAEWSLANLGLGRVQVVIAVENAAALRLAQRGGLFTAKDYSAGTGNANGARVDTVIYSLIPQDIAEL